MTCIIVLVVVGVSTLFWTAVGLVRWAGEQYRRRSGPAGAAVPRSGPEPKDVAVLVAAHNEALVIRDTIASAARLLPLGNIHVVSDMSSDETAQIARDTGVKVLELATNRGKAGALAEGIRHFGLCRRFQVVLLLDADTRLAPDYLSTGLRMFLDPQVMAVAGHAKSIILPHSPRAIGRFLVAYRERLYVVVQLLLKYGQAARHANVVAIVPGFASMYRTSALEHLDVVGQGLIIEDFNMTFDLHAKRLGRIAFHPGVAVAYTQDPDNLHDYIRQVRRWTLGFWQTVRRHQVRFDKFWLNLSVHILELVSSGILMVLLLPVFATSLVSGLIVQQSGETGTTIAWLSGVLPPEAVVIGVLLPDYLLSVFTAVVARRPAYLLFGLLFPLMRILDSAICLSQIPAAWRSTSTGAWKSPRRRAVEAAGPAHVDWLPADPLAGRPSEDPSPTKA